MNLTLSDEQRMLQEAAAGALSRIDTVGAARRAQDGEPLPDLWGTAADAGWTGLLVAEERGGAGLGLFDAMLVAEECGRRLAGAGLYGHLAATLMLEAVDEPPDGLLTDLAAGTLRAAAVVARPPEEDGGEWTVEREHGLRVAAPRLTEDRLTGRARHVPDAAGADVLVVTATDPAGEPVCVVTRSAEVAGYVRYDASRPLGDVELACAEGEVVARGRAAAEAGWLAWQALLAADALGVCGAVLDLGVAYAKERHAFGRPIGSYQAVKHQLVEILRWIDTTRNLCFFTGYAAQEDPAQLPLAASCARFAAEQAADYATRTCIAVHGGIGATWEHDAPFYWRRAQLSRVLLGGLDDAGERVAAEIIAGARALAHTTRGAR